jgi:hypothetical protein
MSEPNLVSIDQAATLATMNRRTFRRRLAAGEIPTVRSFRDRRVKLISLTDLRRFMGEEGVPMQKTG